MSLERARPKSPTIAKIVLWAVLVCLYAPLVYLVSKTFLEASVITEIFQDEVLLSALHNSLIVAVSTSVIATLIGAMAALALYREKGLFHKALNGLSLLSLVFPEIVFALSLLGLFFVFGWELGLPTVIIAHVTFSLSYVMMIVGARLANFDSSILDAARDLGASEGKVVTTVMVPILKPAIISAAVLSFLLSFDDFLITYFVNGVGQDTLPVKLYAAMKTGLSPKLTALASLMLLVTLVSMFFLFRVMRSLVRRN